MPQVRDDEFERLWTEHSSALLAFLVYKTGDRPLSEDLLVDTFERVLRGRRGFDRRKGTEKAWLYTIALNLVRDHARRRAVEERSLRQEHATAGRSARAVVPQDAVSERDALQQALAGLTDDERELVALRFGADLTVGAIAGLLGIKEPAAEVRLRRALDKLRGLYFGERPCN